MEDWVDRIIEAEDKQASDQAASDELESQRTAMLLARSPYLWAKFAKEVKERVKRYTQRRPSEQPNVRFEERSSKRILVSRSAPLAELEIWLNERGALIEYYRLVAGAGEESAPQRGALEIKIGRSHALMLFDGQGRTDVGPAVEYLLKPILFPGHGDS